MRITLSVCRKIYEDYFEVDLPGDLAYKHAAEQVLAEVGQEEFTELVHKAEKAVDLYPRGNV